MDDSKALTLSIIIPAYNEENHLPACLASIAAQTVAPDEVIVVDNNSTDKTAQVAKKYPFVKLVKELKQGRAYARTRGFNAAKSDILGRIDADTILGPDWVERVQAFYADKSKVRHGLSGGCYFYNMRFGHAGGWWQGQVAFRVNRLLLGHYIFFGSNMAIPASIWQRVKPSTCSDPDIHEDLDLAIHWHRLGYQITYHDDLKVGIKMRRVFEDRDELWQNMVWWPNTLRRHGLKTWVLGWLGAVALYAISFAYLPFKK